MRRWMVAILAGLALGCGHGAWASDPVPYKVEFRPSGDGRLDELLKETSSLVALQKKLPAAPFALIGRAQADAQQFGIVLHSLGYDAGSVDITIDGLALSDPVLLDTLTQAPQHQTALVEVAPRKGALFLLGDVAMPGLPHGFVPPATVKPGEAARAAPILAARATLQTALHNAGYAFASVSPPLAMAQLAAHRLDVTYTVKAWPRVNIGAVRFEGLTRTDAAFLRRHIPLKQGQRYSDTALATARESLLGLGVFASVTPVPQYKLGPDGEVPVVFRVTEQKRHAVTLSGSYATDNGFTIAASWEDRNMLRHAETLTFTVAGNGLGGTGTTAPGYDLKGVFAKPDYETLGQELSLSAEALQQSLTAYNRTAVLLGAALARPVTKHTTLSFGPAFTSEQVQQQGFDRTYVLLQFPVSFAYDTVDSVLEPTKGVNASVTLTPTEPVLGDRHLFVIAQATAATYLQVESNARGSIAVRGQIGSVQGTTQFNVPPDQRFYAGGSGTVRGYTYQTIGPLFSDDEPEGGLAMDAVNLEFRQRLGQNFGIVPFIDAGQVSAGSVPFQGTFRVGVGLGARYYTSIGPIRVDLAFPMTRVAGSNAFALYIGLGEAF